MLIKPSAMDGALYGIPLAWIHYYKIKEPPKINPLLWVSFTYK